MSRITSVSSHTYEMIVMTNELISLHFAVQMSTYVADNKYALWTSAQLIQLVTLELFSRCGFYFSEVIVESYGNHSKH